MPSKTQIVLKKLIDEIDFESPYSIDKLYYPFENIDIFYKFQVLEYTVIYDFHHKHHLSTDQF